MDCQKTAIDRLAAIEDILGDEYDLNRLLQLVSQRLTMREDVSERMKLVGNMPIDRLRDLVEAHRDRRCVIYQKGFPVASTYYKQIDGLCVREASGVVSEEEYEAAVKRGWDG